MEAIALITRNTLIMCRCLILMHSKTEKVIMRLSRMN